MIRRSSTRCLLLAFSVVLVSCAGAGQNLGPTPTVASLSVNGPYEVGTYTTFPDAPEFADATIYYPLDASTPVGGVAISPGFTERQSHIDWWGPRLASHGYAVLIFDTNDPRDRPDVRADALIAAVRTLKAENTREDSPLLGRIDVGKMAVMGHSMGGGGALLAANEHGDEIQAVIPFTPWEPEGGFDRISDPTLIIAGSADGIAAVSEHAWPHFQSIPESTPKVYIEIDGGDHFIADSDRGPDLATIGRYGIAWLKLSLDGDERYGDFIYGERSQADRDMFSRYVTNEEMLSSAPVGAVGTASAAPGPSASGTLASSVNGQASAGALRTVADPGPIPRPQPVGTMSDLMVKIIYPYSDAIFYILTRTPTSSVEWTELEGKALMLAESANLLMMPNRARDDDQWMRDARLLLEAGEAAYRAAMEKDVEALSDLNEQLYRSCVTCHLHYRPGYGRGR